jgi:hypothetical protein
MYLDWDFKDKRIASCSVDPSVAVRVSSEAMMVEGNGMNSEREMLGRISASINIL